ncbi:uncharacterized protein LTR77_009104 [Saxophila tyrrhenica]|uniref:Uncharacterized protein n=1 Tax=Saxophila tyrrhenica TaxID=1690608 RepID=A0AAV9NZS4_9PEZI|nr:hypothetical protein LTR77_009104 [Saxophila tyrrhenica]
MKIITSRVETLQRMNEDLRIALAVARANMSQLEMENQSLSGKVACAVRDAQNEVEWRDFMIAQMKKRYLKLKSQRRGEDGTDSFGVQDDKLFCKDENVSYENDEREDVNREDVNRENADQENADQENENQENENHDEDHGGHAQNEDNAQELVAPVINCDTAQLCDKAADSSLGVANQVCNQPLSSTISTASLPIEMPEPICTRCLWHRACRSHNGPGSLESTTRLNDQEYYGTRSQVCAVPVDVQLGLMRAALELAQEALWYYLRKHWPHIQRRLYPESPKEVKFGRDELADSLGQYYTKKSTLAFCNTLCICSSVTNSMADLRNATYHFRSIPTSWVDSHMQSAQAMAIEVLDEARATKVRQLRDDLQAESTKAFELMRGLVFTAELNEASWEIPWPLHIESDLRYPRGYPGPRDQNDAVRECAARLWKERQGGVYDRDYPERKAEAAKFMKAPTFHHDDSERLDVATSSGFDASYHAIRPLRVSLCFARSLPPSKLERRPSFWALPHSIREQGEDRPWVCDFTKPEPEAELGPEEVLEAELKEEWSEEWDRRCFEEAEGLDESADLEAEFHEKQEESALEEAVKLDEDGGMVGW